MVYIENNETKAALLGELYYESCRLQLGRYNSGGSKRYFVVERIHSYPQVKISKILINLQLFYYLRALKTKLMEYLIGE